MFQNNQNSDSATNTLCAICKQIVGASGGLDPNDENTEADSPSKKGPLSAEELGELSRASFMSSSGMDFSSGAGAGGSTS